MTWGDPGISRKLAIEDGVQPWVVGGTPTPYRLQPSGILESLRLSFDNMTETIVLGGGTLAVDTLGPWNMLTNISLGPSQQTPIVQVTGFGDFMIMIALTAEGQVVLPGLPALTTPAGAIMPNTTNVENACYQIVTAATGVATIPFFVPVAQTIKSFGGMVGYWPLSNPLVQMILSYTPNAAGVGPTYNVQSTAAFAEPLLATGAATATFTSPIGTVIKNGWDTPALDSDLPPFTIVSSWIEESFQTTANGATKLVWTSTPLSGLIARLGFYVMDGGTGLGATVTQLASPTAIQLVTGQLQPKIQESYYDAAQRQERYYGFSLPQGTFMYDFLGPNLTLQDVLNTNMLPNIQLIVTLASALGSTVPSQAKIVKQLIAPIVPTF
jgi:hypothetical protein